MAINFANGTIDAGFQQNNNANFTTSATYQDITVPTWATRVLLNIDAFSPSGGHNMTIQLINSGGVRTSGYYGTGWYNNGNQGITQHSNDSWLRVPIGSAAHTLFGQIVIDRMPNTNIYTITGSFGDSNSTLHSGYAGRCDLGGTITGVRMGFAGSNIDSGSWAITFTNM